MRIARSARRISDEGQRHARQTRTTGERRPANARHAVGNIDADQTAARRERLGADARYAFGNDDFRQSDAASERLIANTCNTASDRNTFQIFAFLEGRTANGTRALGDSHACQTATTVKREITNTRHAA